MLLPGFKASSSLALKHVTLLGCPGACVASAYMQPMWRFSVRMSMLFEREHGIALAVVPASELVIASTCAQSNDQDTNTAAMT